MNVNVRQTRARQHRPLETSAARSSSLATNTIAILFVVGFYYLAYRYPLQIGSSLTSPTYSDTPVGLQVGKYVLVALVVVGAAFAARMSGTSIPLIAGRENAIASMGLLVMSFFSLFKGLATGATDLITLAFVLATGVVLSSMSLRWNLDAARLSRFISFYAVVCVAANAVEIALYRFTGRLPSLGYEGSVSVRFGSVLDDPNGFAVMVALLVPVVFIGWRRHSFWRFVFVASLLASLVLTQSFTGIVAVVIAALVGYVALHSRSANRLLLLLVVAFALALATWAFTTGSQLFTAVLGTKGGSITLHAGSLSELASLPFPAYLGLGDVNQGIESSYVYLLANVGLPFTIAFILVGLGAAGALRRRILAAADGEDTSLYSGFFYFILAMLVASVNLQLVTVFPLNLLYVLGIAIAFFVTPPVIDLSRVPRSLRKHERVVERSRS